MKAMSQTMYLVVAAIVIMVTALVVIVIFWQGVTPAIGLTEAKSMCQTQATISCTSMNQMPPTWNVENVKIKEGSSTYTTSCSKVPEVTGQTCDAYTQGQPSGTSSNGDIQGAPADARPPFD